MTKELSKQLCELCGVEAKPLGYTNNEVLDTDCKGDCIDCTWYDNDLYYPDFGQPENFVKLLEVILNNGVKVEFDYQHNKNHKTVIYINSADAVGLNLTDAIANYISDSCQYYEFDETSEKTEQLKQSIREAGWKYEFKKANS